MSTQNSTDLLVHFVNANPEPKTLKRVTRLCRPSKHPNTKVRTQFEASPVPAPSPRPAPKAPDAPIQARVFMTDQGYDLAAALFFRSCSQILNCSSSHCLVLVSARLPLKAIRGPETVVTPHHYKGLLQFRRCFAFGESLSCQVPEPFCRTLRFLGFHRQCRGC